MRIDALLRLFDAVDLLGEPLEELEGSCGVKDVHGHDAQVRRQQL